MANVFVDRVRVQTATTGTGTITLGSAVAGFRSFSQAVTDGDLADGNTVYYCIEDGLNWEVGQGTYSNTAGTLTRTVASSSTGAALSLSGNASVFITIPSAAMSLSALNQHVNVFTTTGNYTATSTDNIIVIKKTTGAATQVTLPSSPSTGRIITVKDGKGDCSVNNITITPDSGTIDGGANVVLNVNYASVDLVYNGSEWGVI